MAFVGYETHNVTASSKELIASQSRMLFADLTDRTGLRKNSNFGFFSLLESDLLGPLQRSFGPFGPEIPEQRFPGPLGPGVKEVCKKKSIKKVKTTQKQPFLVFQLFSTFLQPFLTPGPRGPGSPNDPCKGPRRLVILESDLIGLWPIARLQKIPRAPAVQCQNRI